MCLFIYIHIYVCVCVCVLKLKYFINLFYYKINELNL